MFLQGIKPDFLCWPVRRLVIIPNTPNFGLIIFSPHHRSFCPAIDQLIILPSLSSGFQWWFSPLIFSMHLSRSLSQLHFEPVTASYISLIEVHETLLLKSVIIVYKEWYQVVKYNYIYLAIWWRYLATTCFGLCGGHHQVVHSSIRVTEHNVQKKLL